MYCLINDQFVKEDNATISITDRGLTLGDGIFDTMRLQDGDYLEFDKHMWRLESHAQILKLQINMKEIAQSCQAIIEKNKAFNGLFALRTTVTRGIGKRGIAYDDDAQSSVIMRLSPYSAPVDDIKLIIARSVRRNEGSPISRIKSLNYGDQIIAWNEARARNANDAVLLNNSGKVTCTTASNIFMLKGGELLTPPTADGVMDGIIRNRIIHKKQAIEATVTDTDLLHCDQIFISNSLTGLRAVKYIGDRELNTSIPERLLPFTY
jgi:branched-chain amino acid aminotransferase